VRRAFALGLTMIALWPASAMALTDEEIFRDFRFNLINPGARSLAIGGAFISLADDATAAQANPAGLSYLLKPEYFIELRGVDNSGNVDVLKESLPAGIDTTVGTGTDPRDRYSITFASYVRPVGRVTMGFSRQVVLNTSSDTLNTFSFTFTGAPGFFSTEGKGSIQVEQVNYNAGFGIRVNDRFAMGLSVALSTLTVNSEVRNLIVDTTGSVTGTPILEPTLDLATETDDSDIDYGVNLGVIYRPLNKKVGFGAVYRRAPRFTVTEKIDPSGLDISGVAAAVGGHQFENEFNFPDSYGAGAYWRPSERLTFSLDIERVLYSNLVQGFVPGINALTDFDAKFTVDDATGYRVGGEYVQILKGGTPLAYRGGIYTQADTTIRALSTGTNSFATVEAFPGREREMHYTAGVGVGMGRMKLDLAMDFGQSFNQYLVSFIYQGGK
jgi:long-chain fatty acid transport protein